MKKIFFVFFILLLTVSCSDDDSSNYHYELLPVEEADVPDEFVYGQIYYISVKYIRPTECYVYNDVLYEYDYDARNIAVISTVVEDKNCEIIDSDEELTIRVQALQTSPYIFRFWQGDDDDGDPIYLEIVVPVV